MTFQALRAPPQHLESKSQYEESKENYSVSRQIAGSNPEKASVEQKDSPKYKILLVNDEDFLLYSYKLQLKT
jgi:hypothetical protein